MFVLSAVRSALYRAQNYCCCRARGWGQWSRWAARRQLRKASDVAIGSTGTSGSGDRRPRLAGLISGPFAHRGLHGPLLVENSIGAFEAAVAAGYGLELDVQETRDGRACVFHDDQLDRLTEASGPLLSRTLDELKSIALRGCGERIASLERVLEVVAGQVPILVELKISSRSAVRLCEAVHAVVDGYRGPLGVMSYHPGVSRWFRRTAPHILRGLVVRESGRGAIRSDLIRRFAVTWARPDFLAYNVDDLPSHFAARMRARGVLVLAWTVRTDADRARAAAHADQIIFEAPPG